MAEANWHILAAASLLVRRHRWLPVAATLTSGLAVTIAVAAHLGRSVALAATAVLVVTSYVWGYSTRAFKQTRWPSLDHLHRRQYAEVWDALTPSAKQATEAASGVQGEDELRRSAMKSLHDLLELVSIGAQDEVLEIGCGVGRVGLVLAPLCRLWTGADISANMLAYASRRLRDVNNVRLVKLHRVGLEDFTDSSFHVVYTTDMFEHLDEMDRWRYVEEAFRVLRSGGRIYIDNIDLESDAGWASFVNDGKKYQGFARTPYVLRPSTAAELMAYVKRAGFTQVQSHRRPPLIVVTAVKPA